jgi:deoxyribodipyrimidine photo-lyase
MKRSLYWVTKDLRLNDNLALQLASKSENLLCVFVVDKRWFDSNNFQSKPLGDKRWHFLQSCLSDFNHSLLNLGQQLYIVYGDTFSTLSSLCDKYNITDVITTHLPGSYENNLIAQLSDRFPQLTVKQVEQFTLFKQEALPFELQQLPASYSKFKKVIAEVPIPNISPAINALPPMFKSMPLPTIFRPQWLPTAPYKEPKQGHKFDGGEQSAIKHLERYFGSDLPLSYKNVRNNLEGWKSSSKLSPWLGYGCISPRQVMASIIQYEVERGKNSSTECLSSEILWREYFQWSHFKVGAKTYKFKGLVDNPPLTTFYPERFNKWCLGNTPYPLVNACMNELRVTGYLSNRGRQIVASCLVNELSVDWRYGAAWFEEQLIDYDAAVNWGNWQYIAGVGVDPRGGRHFNLEKQTALFDPDNRYQSKWALKSNKNNLLCEPLDSVDASDWPVPVANQND